MLAFLRPELVDLHTYTPHPEAASNSGLVMDRLDTNECPYDLPPTLKEKLAWFYQQQIEANRYPDGSHGQLKVMIADYVSESAAVQVSPAQISVGNGSDELIRSLLIATCLGGQGAILVANPTFSMYSILAQTLGIPVMTVGRTATFAFDLDAATAAMQAANEVPIRMVFVVHPNSPTGNPLTASEIEWLRQLPEDILVVIDEAYFEFSQQTLVAELGQHANWIVLRTFSKAFRLAAHRVGYGIAHPELIQVLEKVRLPYNLPAMSQAAAHLALTHREELLHCLPELQAERSRVYAALSQLEGLKLWPSMANFIYVQRSTEAATADLGRYLKQLGTSVRFTGGGLRITIGTPAENTRIVERIQQVLNLGSELNPQ